MRVTIIGCGDAFGSGGRFNTCFLLEAGGAAVLVDCGATSLVALRKAGVDPARLDGIVISHLHGDHFGGIPFLLLDARYIGRRARPLLIAGPPGLRERLRQTVEVLFPGLSRILDELPLDIREMEPEQPHALLGLTVRPVVVEHPCGSIPFALRIEADGRTFCYSGDTTWTDALVRAGRDADLLVVECSTYDTPSPVHLDLKTLEARLPEVGARRILLTHMGPDVLARRDSLPFEAAEEGLVITL